ncbi:jg11037 [Pararge aegeria aegeria]|uniref:Jg11037 protein n=1 Tax=Pararge aegeria aegeria TaxID=348720 RepID=A0A8S4QH64_9NEOP|nr:jg11037 [Pararge aegeria aegeria]
MNAFKKAGICPFNPGNFTEEDYAPSFETDRPLLQAMSSRAESNEEPLQPSSMPKKELQFTPIKTNQLNVNASAVFYPEIVKPLPKVRRKQEKTKQVETMGKKTTIIKKKVKARVKEREKLNEEYDKKARVIVMKRICNGTAQFVVIHIQIHFQENSGYNVAYCVKIGHMLNV